jgi:hypothetical protein
MLAGSPFFNFKSFFTHKLVFFSNVKCCFLIDMFRFERRKLLSKLDTSANNLAIHLCLPLFL